MGSDVWRHFEKYKDEDGKVRARCNLCKNDFDGSSRMGTTRLRNHYESCQRRKRGGGGDISDEAAIAIKEKTVVDQQLSHLDTTRMIIKQGIPAPNSINAADIMDVYNQEKEKLRKCFEKLSCRFSLKIDQVGFSCSYACLTVCFIDDDWKLKKKIIGIEYIEDDQNFGEHLKNVLLEWGIENNISFMINMTCHDKYVISSNERENWFSGQGVHVAPIDCICDVCDEGLDKIKRSLYDYMSEILNYVTETSSKNVNFQIAIEKAKSLGLKEAFFVLENMDPDFKSINLTKEQWDQIRAIYECYEDLTHIAFLDHWRKYKTANMYFPMICSLYTKSLLMAKHEVWFKESRCYFAFKSKANRYWCEYKSVLAAAAVLDPRFKMDIVQHWYKKIYGDECEAQLAVFTDYFINVYNEYAKRTKISGSQQTNSSISYEMLDFSGKLCKSSHNYDNVQLLNSELYLYLNEFRFPLFKNFNILKWWRDHAEYFPTLVKMARDFL
ncbi:hypothetical protein JRO89_XS03G0033000 [Xanthoceras sorbifolium]|uniref:BED-type domain-containing protein n=1 Tax=Xanthoceras sorbifolium TaxID=99658 RepID=A0ABQ8I8E6_9ROSI|nr:hypothetical protein JRO89_XS03G0033000 [Xanthoceras sorbifolium]